MPINIKNLFHTYSKDTPFQNDALHDINLTIEDNDFVAFVGATGSGKSTLIQHLNALLLPTEGVVEVDDFVVTNNKKKNKNIHQLRKHLGLVFQFPEYQLFEETVESDVAFGPLNFKIKKEEALNRAHEALKAVGLNETYFSRSPFELSGGEKRRVALAGILAIDPDILVLDEPTAGLDPIGAKTIMDLVAKMHQNGKTIILVTHDMDIVNTYANKMVVLDEGRIVSFGTPKDVFKNLKNNTSIDLPQIYQVINKFNEYGLDIDASKISTIDELVEYVYKRKENK